MNPQKSLRIQSQTHKNEQDYIFERNPIIIKIHSDNPGDSMKVI